MRELTAIQFTVCCSESSSEPRVYTPQLGGRYYWQILSEPLVLPHSSQREREREREPEDPRVREVRGARLRERLVREQPAQPSQLANNLLIVSQSVSQSVNIKLSGTQLYHAGTTGEGYFSLCKNIIILRLLSV